MKKLLKISLLSLFILFLTLHTGLHIGRDMAVQWLLDQGAESARIHSLQINWLTGRLRVQGVEIRTPEQPDLRMDRLALQLDYGALFKQRILITGLTLEGTALNLRQVREGETDHFYLGPVALPAAETEAEEQPATPSRWAFGVADVQINDFSFQALLPDQSHNLMLNEGYLDALYTWERLAFTQVMLKGAINGADFDLDTRSQPLPDTKRSELTIKLDKLPLHSVTGPFVPGLEAVVSVDLTLQAEAGEQISLQQKGSIRVESFRFRDKDFSVSQRRLLWQGDVSAELMPGEKQKVAVNGQLQGAGLRLKQQDTDLALADLNWQGRVALSGMNSAIQQIRETGTLHLSGLEAMLPDLAVSQQQLSWNGGVDLALDQQGLQNIAFKGDVKGSNSDLRMTDRLHARLSSLNWKGDLDMKPSEQGFSIRGEQGALSLGALNVQSAAQQGVVRSEGLELQDISLALPDSLAVGNLSGRGIRVAPASEKPSLAELNVALKQLQLTLGQRLDIASVAISDLKVDETLSKDKQPRNTDRLLAAVEQLSGPSPEAAAGTDDKDAATGDNQPLRVSIGELTINGDSRVRFRDQSVSPAFSTELALQKVRVTGLDTVSQKPAAFDLDLKLNSFTRFDLKGTTNLAAGGENAEWQGHLKQLDLPRISPYSIGYTGYYLNSGQLYLTSTGTLKQGQIDGNNEIRINRLEVEVADQDQMAKFSKQLSMPLGTAISILQDSDDNIELDVPVSGSLDDPDFGLQSVVKLLAGKGLKQAAFSFLTKSLQPYGTLISLAGSAIMEGAFVTLQPVSFTPGQAQLNVEGLDYLGKISTMMADRKGMRLNICGQVVQQDQQLIVEQLAKENAERKEPLDESALAELEQERLVALAQQRSDAVKSVLLQSLPGERLFSCFPVPKLDDPAAPPQALLAL
ncbi:MAG: DUF748 domain-containing protein [Amphritea sp.]|nr:DUF748 domain-containing protein [Amphritea sp.]